MAILSYTDCDSLTGWAYDYEDSWCFYCVSGTTRQDNKPVGYQEEPSLSVSGSYIKGVGYWDPGVTLPESYGIRYVNLLGTPLWGASPSKTWQHESGQWVDEGDYFESNWVFYVENVWEHTAFSRYTWGYGSGVNAAVTGLWSMDSAGSYGTWCSTHGYMDDSTAILSFPSWATPKWGNMSVPWDIDIEVTSSGSARVFTVYRVTNGLRMLLGSAGDNDPLVGTLVGFAGLGVDRIEVHSLPMVEEEIVTLDLFGFEETGYSYADLSAIEPSGSAFHVASAIYATVEGDIITPIEGESGVLGKHGLIYTNNINGSWEPPVFIETPGEWPFVPSFGDMQDGTVHMYTICYEVVGYGEGPIYVDRLVEVVGSGVEWDVSTIYSSGTISGTPMYAMDSSGFEYLFVEYLDGYNYTVAYFYRNEVGGSWVGPVGLPGLGGDGNTSLYWSTSSLTVDPTTGIVYFVCVPEVNYESRSLEVLRFFQGQYLDTRELIPSTGNNVLLLDHPSASFDKSGNLLVLVQARADYVEVWGVIFRGGTVLDIVTILVDAAWDYPDPVNLVSSGFKDWGILSGVGCSWDDVFGWYWKLVSYEQGTLTYSPPTPASAFSGWVQGLTTWYCDGAKEIACNEEGVWLYAFSYSEWVGGTENKWLKLWMSDDKVIWVEDPEWTLELGILFGWYEQASVAISEGGLEQFDVIREQ